VKKSAAAVSPKAIAPKPAAPKAAAVKPAKPAQPGDKVVLRIGEETVTQSQFEAYIELLPDQYRTQALGRGKRQFAEQIVSMKTLAQEAKKRKLDQTPDFARQVEQQKENILAGLVYADLSGTLQIGDDDARAYYEKNKSQYERVRARHILIRAKGSAMPAASGKPELTEEEALAKCNDLRKKLLAGEEFAALAKAESDDTGSGANGGDLGFFERGRMVPPFEQAAFSLPPKQVSEPVKTAFGYHLILVEQRDAKTFDELRPDLEKKMRPELARKAMEDLKKSVTVQMDDGYFGPAQPATGK
jgi:peptidyl-prolyl cis-trans isomerase C